MKSLPRPSPGDPIRAEDVRALSDAINSMRHGRIGDRLPKRDPQWWIGLIVSEGPNAEADWTDDRYWVRRAYCDNDGNDEVTDRNTFAPKEEPADRLIVTAQNGAEYRCRSHMLTTSVLVQVWPIRDTIGVMRYMFWSPPGFAVFEG